MHFSLKFLIFAPLFSDRNKFFLIKNQLIKNCPVTIEDIKVAEDIFGKNIYALKGKTTQKLPYPIEINYVEVPRELLRLHKDVTLSADIFFVQGQPFFVTLSRKIKFYTLECLSNMKKSSLINACDNMINTYSQCGFKVTTMLME